MYSMNGITQVSTVDAEEQNKMDHDNEQLPEYLLKLKLAWVEEEFEGWTDDHEHLLEKLAEEGFVNGITIESVVDEYEVFCLNRHLDASDFELNIPNYVFDIRDKRAKKKAQENSKFQKKRIESKLGINVQKLHTKIENNTKDLTNIIIKKEHESKVRERRLSDMLFAKLDELERKVEEQESKMKIQRRKSFLLEEKCNKIEKVYLQTCAENQVLNRKVQQQTPFLMNKNNARKKISVPTFNQKNLKTCSRKKISRKRTCTSANKLNKKMKMGRV